MRRACSRSHSQVASLRSRSAGGVDTACRCGRLTNWECGRAAPYVRAARTKAAGAAVDLRSLGCFWGFCQPTARFLAIAIALRGRQRRAGACSHQRRDLIPTARLDPAGTWREASYSHKRAERACATSTRRALGDRSRAPYGFAPAPAHPRRCEGVESFVLMHA